MAAPLSKKEISRLAKQSIADAKIARQIVADLKKAGKDPEAKAKLADIEAHKSAGNRLDATFMSAIVGMPVSSINAVLIPAAQLAPSTRAAPAAPFPMGRGIMGSSSDTTAQIQVNGQIQADEAYAQALDMGYGIDPLDELFSYGMYQDMAEFVPSASLRPVTQQAPSAAIDYGPPDLSTPKITNYHKGIAISNNAAEEANAITSVSPPMSPVIPMRGPNMALISAITAKQPEVERRHSELADKHQQREELLDEYQSVDDSQRRDLQKWIAFHFHALNHRTTYSEMAQFFKLLKISKLRKEMNDIVDAVSLDMIATDMGASSLEEKEDGPDMPEDMGGDYMEDAPAAASSGLQYDVFTQGALQSWNRDHGFVNTVEFENNSPIRTFRRPGKLSELIRVFVEGKPFELDAKDFKKLKEAGVFNMNVGNGVGGGEYEPRLDPKLWKQNGNGSWSYAYEFFKARDAKESAKSGALTERFANEQRQKQANTKRAKKMVSLKPGEIRAMETNDGPVYYGRKSKGGGIIEVNPSGVSNGLGKITNKMDPRGGDLKYSARYKDFTVRSAHPDNVESGFSSAIPAPPPAATSSGLYNPAATGFFSDQLSRNARQTAGNSLLMSAAERVANTLKEADIAKEDKFRAQGGEFWNMLNKRRREEEENATEVDRHIGRDIGPAPSAALVPSITWEVPSASALEAAATAEALGISEWDVPMFIPAKPLSRLDMELRAIRKAARDADSPNKKAQNARDEFAYQQRRQLAEKARRESFKKK